MNRSFCALALLTIVAHSAAQAPASPPTQAQEKKIRWFVDCNGNRPATVTVSVTEVGDYQIPAELVLKRCLTEQPA
jgi:invasion protein IalB